MGGTFLFLVLGGCALVFPLRLVDPDIMEIGRRQDHRQVAFFFFAQISSA